VEVLQYQTFGSTRLVLAIPEKSPVRSLVDLNGLRVATEFPGICQRFFADTGVDVTQIEVSGTCKAAPQLGVAGAIVDLTSPWVMLEINKLRVV
jgi:ATP phosphoribosyltransferase